MNAKLTYYQTTSNKKYSMKKWLFYDIAQK